MRGCEIADQTPECGSSQQCLVGKAELHPEEDGKPDGHAGKIRIQAHLKVFPHECSRSDHLVQRAEIQSSGKLEGERKEDINPRAHLFRDEIPEHWHRKFGNISRSGHFST